MRMQAWAAHACAIVLVGALSACGGGDGMVRGLAATGAALANAPIQARCVTGTPWQGRTDDQGRFVFSVLERGLPCMVAVDAGAQGVLHSLAQKEGRLNVTPLTELVLAQAAQASPAQVFADFGKARAKALVQALPGATLGVASTLAALLGRTPEHDPLTQPFEVGDAEDQALDNLQLALSGAGMGLDDLRQATQNGALAARVERLRAVAEAERFHNLAVYLPTTVSQDARSFPALTDADAALNALLASTSRWAGLLPGQAGAGAPGLAPYRIEVPARWNGKLVVWGHGYVGEGPYLHANDFGLSADADGGSYPEETLRKHLLRQGYAWVASSYSKNSYDVRAAIEDSNYLVGQFQRIAADHERVLAPPERIYAVGGSMGGHWAAAVMEQETLASAKHTVRYDGAASFCGVLGDTELFDTIAAQGIAATVLTQTTSVLGKSLLDPATVEDAYNLLFDFYYGSRGLQINGDISSAMLASIYTDPAKLERFKAIVKGLTGGERPLFELGWAQGSLAHSFALVGMQLHRAYPLPVSVQGQPTLTHMYGVFNQKHQDTARFSALIAQGAGVDVSAVPVLRSQPHYNRVRRDGLRYVPRLQGHPYGPVLSAHTLGDLFVPFSMQQIYRQRVQAAGLHHSRLVVQRAIRGTRHCDFTPSEIATAFDDLVAWAESGRKPAGDEVLRPAVVAAADYGCRFSDKLARLPEQVRNCP